MSDEDQPISDVEAISSLGDAKRRALYDHVVSHGDWTSRDQAAVATDIERATAAHHLDKLAEDGLLEVDYRRLTGRSGPGAGRPAKVYRRAARDIAVSLPPRRYELAGRVLAAAADRARLDGVPITEAIETEARHAGTELADEMVHHVRSPAAKRSRRARAVVDVLASHGFEPEQDDAGVIVLRNCPFHHLARQHTELICGMNLCLLDEALRSAGEHGLHATLEPEDGRCCVKLVEAAQPGC